MKILVTILSFIVLLLSTVPCSAFTKHSKCSVEKNCENDSHDCGKECNGKCSPFYSCGTCVGFTINSNSVIITEKLEFIIEEAQQTLSYNKFVDSSFFCKIWQPPKTS
ncbi:DUF6660 family protein [Flavobacterium hercynium]|uniref:WAP domain-containing protein n=1 Tax=Flavobacterium hercynium TaxID=387094 RepID=A0A226HCQ1_9FLAO|nr:DUF6660 family protein [Flavobacterium hercynium]OXA92067.1 hypothetical protein B0A66_09865 [Flavobacterium hercynium]